MKYDFSKYRKYKDSNAINKYLQLPVTKEEKEAIADYLDIDKIELKNEFKQIIKDSLRIQNEEVNRRYNYKINSIKELFSLNKDIIAEENKYRRTIIKKHNSIDFDFYREAKQEIEKQKISEYDEKAMDIIVEASIRKMDNYKSCISKLLFITDFNTIFYDASLTDGLIRRMTKGSFYLNEIFNDQKEYEFVIDLLFKEQLIQNDKKHNLIWVGSKKDSTNANKTLLCTLGYVLYERNYLNTNTKTTIAEAIKKSIKADFGARHFSNVFTKLVDRENKNESEYYNQYYFIPVSNT